MKELLEKLLGSEVLTEETRVELTTAIETAIAEAVAAQVTEAKEALTVEYATAFAADREALVEAIDTKVEEMVKAELNELADDISNFRDLEVEFAHKLVEAKAVLAESVEKDMSELVERLDTFLELRLSEEVTELKESIDEVKKNNVGRKIFEAFKAEVEQYAADDAGVEALTTKLEESQALLAEKDALLEAANVTLADNARKEKLEETLASLQNRPREIMEAILKTVPTDKLEETYHKFIDRVLHDSVATSGSEKESANSIVETPVLAEGQEEVPAVEVVQEAVTVVSGDSVVIEESVKPVLSEQAKRLQRLAGI